MYSMMSKNKVGIRPARAKLYKANKKTFELYEGIYESTSKHNSKLAEKFHNGDDPRTMVLAMQHLANEHPDFNQLPEDDQKKIIKKEFPKHHKQAEKDVADGELDNIPPNEIFTHNNSKRIADKKKSEKYDQEAKRYHMTKVAEPIESTVTEGCEEKNCVLDSMKIVISKPNSQWQSIKEAFRFGLFTENYQMQITPPDDQLITMDFQQPKGDFLNYNIIAGDQKFWGRELDIHGEGHCDHKPKECPEFQFQCQDQKIHKDNVNNIYSPSISRKRLLPKSNDFVETLTWDYVYKNYIQPKDRPPLCYDVYARNHTQSYHTDYHARIKVHAPNVVKLALNYQIPFFDTSGKKLPALLQAEFHYRQDQKEHNHKIDGTPKSIMKSVLGDGLLGHSVDAILFMVKVVQKFSKGENVLDFNDSDIDSLPTETELNFDGVEPNQGKIDSELAQEKADKIKVEEEAAQYLFNLDRPTIQFAYRRILKEVPEEFYSRVGYEHELFLAADPLLKISKTFDVINAVTQYKNLIRLTNILKSGYSFFAGAVGELIKYVIKDELSEQYGRDAQSITDEEAKNGLINGTVGLECKITIGASAGTNSPGGGIVWHKTPSDNKWCSLNRENTGVYTGLDITVAGKAGGSLKVMKWCFGAGYEFTTTAENNTAPSRFSVEMRPFNGVGDSPKLRSYMAFSGLAIYDVAYAEIGKKDVGDLTNKRRKSRGETEESEGTSLSSTKQKKQLRMRLIKERTWPKNLEIDANNKNKDNRGREVELPFLN